MRREVCATACIPRVIKVTAPVRRISLSNYISVVSLIDVSMSSCISMVSLFYISMTICMSMVSLFYIW